MGKLITGVQLAMKKPPLVEIYELLWVHSVRIILLTINIKNFLCVGNGDHDEKYFIPLLSVIEKFPELKIKTIELVANLARQGVLNCCIL